ncbi:hypothetical protein Dimus_012511 [Dionaea muscipula]
MIRFRAAIPNCRFNISLSFLSSLWNNTQRPIIYRTLTLDMESQSNSKRPMCTNCSKPVSICLCVRIKTPIVDNRVHVTILQHSLERNHPLNSARIAKLGLKNLRLITVCDVNVEARFEIRPMKWRSGSGSCRVDGECTSGVCRNGCESCESESNLVPEECSVEELVSAGGCGGKSNLERFINFSERENNGIIDLGNGSSSGERRRQGCGETFYTNLAEQHEERLSEEVLSISIGKHGRINTLFHPQMQAAQQEPKLEQFIASSSSSSSSPLAIEILRRGFVVKKYQRQRQQQTSELEEFEIRVPTGSVLVFPGRNSVGTEGISFEVKNLIVLDGTWAKAKRIYNENPWLSFLPCLRLDVDANKLSLFREVRHQPKPGYLSTIESIVYALESFRDNNNLEGLYDLLIVFESMVHDQRRCKDERLRKARDGSKTE